MYRTYSTREVAQMWNISESTVKRWTEAGELECQKTPGGHRKFHLGDIRRFQESRGFEANGLLTTEKWTDPHIEDVLNRMDLQSLQGQVRYLAARNQRRQIGHLLMRLYLRGISLANLYDNVLLPVLKSVGEALSSNDLSRGQAEIIRINIETATDYFFPEMVSRSNNGKLALCASPARSERFIVNATARILEVEGWEVLNLGDAIPFQTMANIVEQEPINLVCVFWGETSTEFTTADIEPLKLAVQSYRLPFVRIGSPSLLREEAGSVDRFTFSDLQSLRNFLKTAARS